MTWWIGDAAGALVFHPSSFYGPQSNPQFFGALPCARRAQFVVAAIAVGVVAYSPLIGQTAYRDALGSSRSCRCCGQRYDATSVRPRPSPSFSRASPCGTLAAAALRADSLNDSFLLLVMFLISIRCRAWPECRRCYAPTLGGEPRHGPERARGSSLLNCATPPPTSKLCCPRLSRGQSSFQIPRRARSMCAKNRPKNSVARHLRHERCNDRGDLRHRSR